LFVSKKVRAKSKTLSYKFQQQSKSKTLFLKNSKSKIIVTKNNVKTLSKKKGEWTHFLKNDLRGEVEKFSGREIVLHCLCDVMVLGIFLLVPFPTPRDLRTIVGCSGWSVVFFVRRRSPWIKMPLLPILFRCLVLL